jgi:hypothetical protein
LRVFELQYALDDWGPWRWRLARHFERAVRVGNGAVW